MTKDEIREQLVELLSKYFDIGDSYAYNLTRVKTAFSVGTMGLDDFEEFDDETVADIADHLLANGVTLATDTNVGGKWIPVSERLPDVYIDEWGDFIPFLVCEKGTEYPFRALYGGKSWCDGLCVFEPTHWMPLPEPPKEDDNA